MTKLIMDRHEIFQDDCLEVLGTLPNALVDVVVTSPPYNLGTAYRSYDDRRPRDSYLAWMQEVGSAIHRIMKPSGSFFLNVGSTNADPWLTHDVAAMMRTLFVLQNHIVWIKSISIGQDTVGHFKPITSRRYLNQNHEALFHFTHNGDVSIDRLAVGVPFKDKSNIERRGHAQDKRCAGNTWFIPYETVQAKHQKYNHPASFPIALPLRCIEMHGVSDGVVLDPFMGTGSTLVAAQRLGHRGIGIEIDALYAQAAVARLQQEITIFA